jgi:ankyrin repeat protein
LMPTSGAAEASGISPAAPPCWHRGVLQDVMQSARTKIIQWVLFAALWSCGCAATTQVDAGAQISADPRVNVANLVRAVEACNVPAVKALLAVGVDPNQRTTDYDRKIPLVQAVIKNCLPAAIALLDAKARPDAREGLIENTALMEACTKGATEFPALLLAHGANVNLANSRGITPIHYAAQKGSVDLVRLLVSKGADTRAREGQRGRPLIVSAALNPDLAVLRYLVENGFSVDEADSNGYTALMAESASNRADAVRFLLANKADLTRADNDGWTALYGAVVTNALDSTRILIAAGAAVDPVAKDGGATPLGIAAGKGHTEMAGLLLSHGAEVDHPDRHGRTGLARALVKGHWETASVLLDHGASVALVPLVERRDAKRKAPPGLVSRLAATEAAGSTGANASDGSKKVNGVATPSNPSASATADSETLKEEVDKLLKESHRYLTRAGEILRGESDPITSEAAKRISAYARIGRALAMSAKDVDGLRARNNRSGTKDEREAIDGILRQARALLLAGSRIYLSEDPNMIIASDLATVVSQAMISAKQSVLTCRAGVSEAGIAVRLSADLLTTARKRLDAWGSSGRPQRGSLDISSTDLAEITAFIEKSESLCKKGRKTK